MTLVVSTVVHILLVATLPQLAKPYGGAPVAALGALNVRLMSTVAEQPKTTADLLPVKSKAEAEAAVEIDRSVPAPDPEVETLRELPTASSTASSGLPLLDYYYTTREVDLPAKAVGDALLVYPREALQLRISGEVTLKLFIDETGLLVRSEIVSAEPPGIFEDAAEQAVKTMHFSAAQKADQPVRSQRMVLITFDPQPTESPGSATRY